MNFDMRQIRVPIIGLLCGALVGVTARLASAQEATVRLKGNLSPAIGQARPIGSLDKGQEIRFAITLPLRNQAALDALLQSLYSPADPLYHQFLKTGEFAQRFGPTQADYDAVIAFAGQNGLHVTGTHASRTVLDVAGPAQAVEKAFSVRLLRFESDTGRVFHAPDAEPAFPASIAAKVSGVVGLDDAVEPRSNLVMPPEASGIGEPAVSPNGIGTGPDTGLSPSDIKSAYNLNGITQTGSGQTIALFEFDGYKASDITTYEDHFGITQVPLVNVLLDGVSGIPTAATPQQPYPGGPAEVTLDIELAIAMAPGAAILVYEGNNFVDIFQKIADQNIAQQVSSSWYDGLDSGPNGPSSTTRDGEQKAFQQMAAQGQSLYIATGDYGDQVCLGKDSAGNCNNLQFGVQDPSAQPYCTAVGGTTLATNGPGGAWASETAWNGSTGGISTYWVIPSYQSAAISPGSGGSSTYRNLPDVSLNSDPNTGYAIYYYGTWFGSFGGTSCAAPMWAGYTALVNQYRGSQDRLGFLNPTLYYLAHAGHYAFDFHDITSGTNGTYHAVSGYDNVTGWGTFNGGNLFDDLVVNTGAAFWVDGNFPAPGLGVPSWPYTTVSAAVNAAWPNVPTLIYIKGNTYPGNFTIGKHVLLVNNGGGAVRIGH